MLPKNSKHAAMAHEVTTLVHKGRKDAAAGVFARFCGMPSPEAKPAVWDEILLNLYHWLLNNNALEEAAQLLWSEKMFNPHPQCSREVWKLFDESNQGLIMGAASMSKSYTMGVRLFLEWTRDPMYTTVKVIGPSAQHLQDNLFSHLVRLHQAASIPMPGEVGDLFMGMDRRDRGSSVSGVIIPIGQNKKAGRIQGAKCFQRKQDHIVFGSMSRLFIFLDEIENVPEGVWSDIDNVLSTVTEDPRQSAKIFGAFNPVNPAAEVAKRAEPQFGWKDLDPDVHFRWKSIRGWDVLRLDALQSENVLTGKTIYPGLQTRYGVEKIARNAGGTDAPGYLAMVRAVYPTQGASLAVFSPGIVNRLKGQFIWYDDPVPAAGVDLALEGAASAVFTKGSFGAATGIIYPPSLEHPDGRKVMFRHPTTNMITPHWALQVEAQFSLPKGDTVAMYESIVSMCRKLRIKPEHVCVDRTGNGAGVHDLLRNQWSLAVQGVNYSEGATERKIMVEDLKPPSEEYQRIVTELWMAMRAWAEFNYLLIDPSVDTTKLFPQMIERKYTTNSGKTKVQSKRDYISMGKSSPDETDSLSLLVHAVRCSHSVVLSMSGDPEYDPSFDGDDADSVRIDPTNRFDSLDI